MEAFTLMLEGIEKDTIDAAAIRFGMPMGPIELADVVGLDVCMKVAETLATGDVEAQRNLLQQSWMIKRWARRQAEAFTFGAKVSLIDAP